MFRRYLAAIGAAFAAVFAIYLKGRRDAREDDRAQDDAEYIETRKRVEERAPVDPTVPDAEWLRARRNR